MGVHEVWCGTGHSCEKAVGYLSAGLGQVYAGGELNLCAVKVVSELFLFGLC